MAQAHGTVADVMTTRVVTLEAGEKLDLAEDIMHVGRIRHMPVVDDKRLVGIVSVRDLLAVSLSRTMDFEPSHRRAFLRAVEASEAMTPNPLTVSPDTDLAVAAGLLTEQKIGCLPVVDGEGTLLGIVTETDMVRAAYLGDEGSGRLVDLDEARQRLRAFKDRAREHLAGLERNRDEVRVQMHLAKAEARDQWSELERKWHELQRRAATVVREAEEPLEEAQEVVEELAEDLRDGYERIRKALER